MKRYEAMSGAALEALRVAVTNRGHRITFRGEDLELFVEAILFVETPAGQGHPVGLARIKGGILWAYETCPARYVWALGEAPLFSKEGVQDWHDKMTH